MKSRNDKSFEELLKQNKPKAPTAKANEAQMIWARIVSEGGRSHGRRFIIAGVLASALALLVSLSLTRSHIAPVTEVGDEELLVEEAFEVDFIEGEEMFEIAELVRLAD